MGRAPCCDKANVKKGPWSPEEDAKLKDFMDKFGTGGNWIALPQKAGLKRCGKSCRLRWLNYLRPNIKHGEFTDEEDKIICTLFASIGSRWSIIASQLPGRTDNDIKNYWNTKLKKKLMGLMNPSLNHAKILSPFSGSSTLQAQLLTQSQPALSQLYREYNSFYTQAAKTLTGIDPISGPQNLQYNFPLSTAQLYPSSYNCQQNQGQGLVDLQYSYNPVLKSNNNMLMFGTGNEASCSNSSDGSYGKDHHAKQEEMASQIQGLINSNNVGLINYGKINGDDHNGFIDHQEGNLQCDLEKVKQLISTGTDSFNNNNIVNGNNLLVFNNDETKTTTGEKGDPYFY